MKKLLVSILAITCVAGGTVSSFAAATELEEVTTTTEIASTRQAKSFVQRGEFEKPESKAGRTSGEGFEKGNFTKGEFSKDDMKANFDEKFANQSELKADRSETLGEKSEMLAERSEMLGERSEMLENKERGNMQGFKRGAKTTDEIIEATEVVEEVVEEVL